MKSFSIQNYILLFSILIILGILYKRFEDKSLCDENKNIYESIQKYLLDGKCLAKSKKPILWIHIPYEYNSRNWLSFGSRSSFELNQPYLYLTVKSIINHCDDSFTICIIDDNSFSKLIPNWSIDMTKISNPISSNFRNLGLMKLLYIYGGFICPVSFLCMKDLTDLYKKGTENNKMFFCETINRNVTSSHFDFYPNIEFCGSPKENQVLYNLIEFIQRTISNDFTSESDFLGVFNRWANTRIQNGEINKIDGRYIGTKTVDDKQIVIEDLFSQKYLDLYPGTYGILIPSEEILKRRNFEWFARLSHKEVLKSNTIIGSYLLLSNAPDAKQGILEPLQVKPNWVGFWKTPDYPGLYGLKPNFLGDNLVHF